MARPVGPTFEARRAESGGWFLGRGSEPPPHQLGCLGERLFPLEFRAEVDRQGTRVMGLSSSEDCTIVAGVILA